MTPTLALFTSEIATASHCVVLVPPAGRDVYTVPLPVPIAVAPPPTRKLPLPQLAVVAVAVFKPVLRLTAATVAALTLYDMCKAVEKGITIGPVRLLEKSGGKSGDYARPRRKS